MKSEEVFKIRPAGRHILTIGRDLIQDHYAAIVELVKNAYDADSPDVNIEFLAHPDLHEYSITITDHGHGMSRDAIINKWLVPSTTDKLERRLSPSGRIMQGRKGIGRYAASILGTSLQLETTTIEGEESILSISWSDFETAEHLDDVNIGITTSKTEAPHGTRLIIRGEQDFLDIWTEKQFRKLQFELRKLISPVNLSAMSKENRGKFHVELSIKGFPDIEDYKETIKPYPIVELFDYRISGRIALDGKGILIYEMQKARNTIKEQVDLDLSCSTGCGELEFDIRVYDREKESIESLIERGLKDERDIYVGKNQARKLLNEYNGIGVYRNGFRIRPLGDADFDWLELNKKRIQNPVHRIGSNQVIGYVQIQSEEKSGLTEKSARDGLQENAAFARLKEITCAVIAEIEKRRSDYRKKAGLSRPTLKIEKELARLFSTDILEQNVRRQFVKNKVDGIIAESIIKIINKDAEEKNKAVDEIRKAVAIYQGQATLGKIINVILHEGRRPLSFFKNQIPMLRFWHKSFSKEKCHESIDRILSIANDIGRNAEIFVNLFSRLDPLASGKRSERKYLNLKDAIEGSFRVFDEIIQSSGIKAKIECSDTFQILSWQQDIYAIFTNLIDNSIFWMIEKNCRQREISLNIVCEEASLIYVDYRDTGPGIEPNMIASEIIFDPQFSTKPSGTGLGLAIAGEAAMRNGLELKAFESDQGAWFRLQPKTEGE